MHYALYDEMTCNIEFRTLNSISVPNLVSIAQNFLEPEDPCQINFSLLARATCTPQERHPHWILSRHSMHVTCEFGISGASRLTCRCVRILKCANHLHVHCTCTMHPSPINHTAPSRPCQGAPMYRVWCR